MNESLNEYISFNVGGGVDSVFLHPVLTHEEMVLWLQVNLRYIDYMNKNTEDQKRTHTHTHTHTKTDRPTDMKA